MIVSTLPGRIRIRTPRLADAGFANRAVAAARALAGVAEARANARAACLVVCYDAAVTPEADMEAGLEAICTGRAPGMATPRRPRPVRARVAQASKIGMLATLVPSLAFAAFGRRKLHAWSGAAFLLFAGAHIGVYGRRLLK